MAAAQLQGLADQHVDLRGPLGPQILGHAAQSVAGIRLAVSVQCPDVRLRQHHAAGVGQPDDLLHDAFQGGVGLRQLLEPPVAAPQNGFHRVEGGVEHVFPPDVQQDLPADAAGHIAVQQSMDLPDPVGDRAVLLPDVNGAHRLKFHIGSGFFGVDPAHAVNEMVPTYSPGQHLLAGKAVHQAHHHRVLAALGRRVLYGPGKLITLHRHDQQFGRRFRPRLGHGQVIVGAVDGDALRSQPLGPFPFRQDPHTAGLACQGTEGNAALRPQA